MREWRPWIPGGLLALGCLFSLAVDRQKSMPLVAPLAMIPRVLGGFEGRDVEIGKDEQQAAGMSSYVYRMFQPDSLTNFSVYVGYYDHQTQGKTIHSPKNCLPGAGWEALQATEVLVEVPSGRVPVNRYLLQNGTRRALVYYWYQGRGRVASNEYRVKWELLRDSALHGRSEEALVRIVVFLGTGTDETRALAIANSVASGLIPSVQQVLPT